MKGTSPSRSRFRRNQFRSPSAAWRTNPWSDSFEVGTGRLLRPASSSPSHLSSSVVRWNSSHASSISRSSKTYGGSIRRGSDRSSITKALLLRTLRQLGQPAQGSARDSVRARLASEARAPRPAQHPRLPCRYGSGAARLRRPLRARGRPAGPARTVGAGAPCRRGAQGLLHATGVEVSAGSPPARPGHASLTRGVRAGHRG